MNRNWLALAIAAMALTACNDGSNKHNTTSTSDQNRVGVVKSDDTRVNVRDRNGDTVTPFDQAENSADRAVTQTIRQRIVGDNNFSTNAKNIKIMTIDGVVTLRGPVNSAQEREAIIQKISNPPVNGVRTVDNQLEVIPNNVRQ